MRFGAALHVGYDWAVTRRGSLPGLAAGLLLTAVLAACGSGSTAPAKPPTATEILAKPEKANGLTAAHFTMSTVIPVASGVTASATGEGVIVYKPQPAMHATFAASAGGQTLTIQVITVGGTDYTLVTPGPGKWLSSPSTSNPATLTDSTDASYVGEESLPQGKAWHVKAKAKNGDPFDVWIRESDGYPLKYAITQAGGSGSLSLTFDKFNTGETVTAPPAAQVQASS